MARTLVLSINACWNVLNFRRGLIAALREAGWRVVVLAPADGHDARLAEIGVEHVSIAIDSAGLSPARDLALLARYRRHLKRIGADAFLGFTAKPNIYGSLAAHSLGIPVINNISGLGTAFMKKGPLRSIVEFLYRVALRRSAIVFFQNAEDRQLFLDSRLVRAEQARLLPGSGIDLARFVPIPAEERSGGAVRLPPGRTTALAEGRAGICRSGPAGPARGTRRTLPPARLPRGGQRLGRRTIRGGRLAS